MISTSKRWWKRNNEEEVDFSRDPHWSLLSPWGHGLSRTKKRYILVEEKPRIEGHKDIRVCKDWVYIDEIRRQGEKYAISGPYVGLAAAYAPEIYTCLFPYVSGRFDTFQLHRKDYKLVKPYLQQANLAYKNSGYVQFHVERKNILDHLQSTEYRYGWIDLDMMGYLDFDEIDQIARGVINCAQMRALLAVWHSSNREGGGGDWVIEEYYRPYLLKALNTEFDILEHNTVKYAEVQPGKVNSYPMRVDILTLERKCAKELKVIQS